MTIESKDRPRLLLAALRVVGGGAFLVPRPAVKTFGLVDDAHSRYLIRLFAARNLALTAGLLASPRRARRLWWQVGVGCDALDVAAGALGLRDGKPRASALVDSGVSLLATAIGVAGLVVDGS